MAFRWSPIAVADLKAFFVFDQPHRRTRAAGNARATLSIPALTQASFLVALRGVATAAVIASQPVEAPAVLLVHEQGVYLMSNGQPRDIVGGDAADRSFCAYAIGCLRRRTQTGTRPRAVWSAATTSSRRCHGPAS